MNVAVPVLGGEGPVVIAPDLGDQDGGAGRNGAGAAGALGPQLPDDLVARSGQDVRIDVLLRRGDHDLAGVYIAVRALIGDFGVGGADGLELDRGIGRDGAHVALLVAGVRADVHHVFKIAEKFTAVVGRGQGAEGGEGQGGDQDSQQKTFHTKIASVSSMNYIG